MADLVLDTDVLIELLRNRSEAIAWLDSISNKTVGVSVLTRMELVQGAQNRNEQDTITSVLDRYDVVHLTPIDSQRAMQWFESYYLSHGVEIIDCLIAASAIRLGVPLYTFNAKHYRPLPELHFEQPYQRE